MTSLKPKTKVGMCEKSGYARMAKMGNSFAKFF
jgi:hypothetical protein